MSISGRAAPVFSIALLVAIASSALAAPARLRVRAATRLADAGVVSGSGYDEVRGRLLDDLGQPVAGSVVALALEGAPELEDVRACDGFRAPERSGTEWRMTTDDSGAFCLRTTAVAPGARATLRFGGTAYFAPLVTEFPARPEQHTIRLAIDAPVLEAVLDRPSMVVWVSANPVSGGGYGTRLQLSVRHAHRGAPNPTELASAEVMVGSERARTRIDIPTSQLGPPGLGEIVVSHPGTPTIAPSEARAVVRRVAAVKLSVAGELEPVDPTRGLEVQVGATSVVGAVPGGWVEAILGGRAVAVSPVKNGVTTLKVPLEGDRQPAYDVTLRYVAEEPWWLAGEALDLHVQAIKPNPLRALPWVIAVLAIAYWVIRAWRRPARVLRRSALETSPRGHADVELVEEGSPSSGWTGRVVDAHDGTPVSHATVQIVTPAFDGEGLAAAATTDETGAFTLPPRELAAGVAAQLRIVATHHSTLSRRLPKPGRLVISITSRRRALVERLVSWTRAMGRPWSSAGDPTPGDVAQVASRLGNPDVAWWARSVEEAAYGPTAPDEAREREVASYEPGTPNPLK